jgi:hypothetical protein
VADDASSSSSSSSSSSISPPALPSKIRVERSEPPALPPKPGQSAPKVPPKPTRSKSVLGVFHASLKGKGPAESASDDEE